MLASIYRRTLAVLILFAVLPLCARAEVVISEIMYDPPEADGDRDWIEIYNNGSDAVTIKGGTAGTDSWRIYQESTTGTVNNRTFATDAYEGTMTLGPGEYAIVARDGAAFKSDYTGFSGRILTSGAMSLTGNALPQKIGLRLGSSGEPWSVISYSSDMGGGGDGNSLQLQSSGQWISAEPTPGASNSSSPTENSTTTDSENTSTTTTTTTSSSSSSGNTTSAHYSSVSLSKKSETVIALSAGRDRLGTVGSPLEFKASVNTENIRNSNFSWNFGDGSVESGESINHTYYYPGEYIVVLNATLPEGKAVARVNVKIIEANLVITHADSQRIEVSNLSKNEINLYGRVLVTGNKVFLFPQDTIIKAGQKISFASGVTGLSPTNVTEVQLWVVGDTEQPKIQEKIDEQKAEKIAAVQNEIAVLSEKLAAISSVEAPVYPSAVAVARSEITAPAEPIQELEPQLEPKSERSPQPALAVDAVEELMGEKGKMGRMWDTLKKFFLRLK